MIEAGRAWGRRRRAAALSSRDSLSDAHGLGRRAAPADRAKIPLDGAADHGVSEALYLRDPDDNGVELYWDRPQDKWPRTPDGKLAMFTRHLDLMGLLAAAGEPPKAQVADAAEETVRDL